MAARLSALLTGRRLPARKIVGISAVYRLYVQIKWFYCKTLWTLILIDEASCVTLCFDCSEAWGILPGFFTVRYTDSVAIISCKSPTSPSVLTVCLVTTLKVFLKLSPFHNPLPWNWIPWNWTWAWVESHQPHELIFNGMYIFII
jgi:hypothetical protein